MGPDFATGNVAIDRAVLEQSGLFDQGFRLYGWEDLELGERLRQMGVELIAAPKPSATTGTLPSGEQIPDLIRVEQERARMGLVFYRKHPSQRVRMIIQFTWMHRLLWGLLTLGGLLNERSLRPLLAWLVRRGQPLWPSNCCVCLSIGSAWKRSTERLVFRACAERRC